MNFLTRMSKVRPGGRFVDQLSEGHISRPRLQCSCFHERERVKWSRTISMCWLLCFYEFYLIKHSCGKQKWSVFTQASHLGLLHSVPQIRVWLALLSLRSPPLPPPLRAPRPNRITTDQFKAHVKSIKSDLNQILIRFIPPSCVCPWARRKLCTLHHNVILDAVHRHKCVCVCIPEKDGKVNNPAGWVLI